MPAAAVIPAPIEYIKVVAVKKLLVGFQGFRVQKTSAPYQSLTFTVIKLELFEQAVAAIH